MTTYKSIKRTSEPNCNSPKLELWKSTNKRPKFIRFFCRQISPIQGFNLRINLWWKKSNQQIQYIYPKTVRDDIKPLKIINPQHVYCSNGKCPKPPMKRKRCRFIQIKLKHLREFTSPFGYRCHCCSRITPDSFHPNQLIPFCNKYYKT